jgi:hypothetical protein
LENVDGTLGRQQEFSLIVFLTDRILRVLARAQETGKVLPNRNEIAGGARTARTLANEEAILNIVEEDGTRSIREIAQEVDISSRSVLRFE